MTVTPSLWRIGLHDPSHRGYERKKYPVPRQAFWTYYALTTAADPITCLEEVYLLEERPALNSINTLSAGSQASLKLLAVGI